LSIRVDPDDHAFLSRLAVAEHADISKAVRDLIKRGRVLLAVERYRAGTASLGRAAALAGLSISEMMDVLAQYGVPANVDPDDYRRSLRTLKALW
jgi:predicted HTH domain antitoxin